MISATQGEKTGAQTHSGKEDVLWLSLPTVCPLLYLQRAGLFAFPNVVTAMQTQQTLLSPLPGVVHDSGICTARLA